METQDNYHIFGEDKGNEGQHTSCPDHDSGRLLNHQNFSFDIEGIPQR